MILKYILYNRNAFRDGLGMQYDLRSPVLDYVVDGRIGPLLKLAVADPFRRLPSQNPLDGLSKRMDMLGRNLDDLGYWSGSISLYRYLPFWSFFFGKPHPRSEIERE